MALATLSIDLVAQLAKFEGDMRRAAGVVEQSAQRMGRAFGGIGSVFAGSLLANAATEAVRQIATLVPELVNGVARFQDLEEKTGASAEALAGFQTAADVSGTSVDALAGFMVKLTGTLSKTNDETRGAGAALKALGLDLEAFRALKPEEQFLTLAQRLNQFADGSGKTAIAIALLGKSGADALPFFKELAQSGVAQNRLTAEQIRLADDLADRNTRLRSELRQAAQVVALQALPAFSALVEEFGKALRATAGLDDAVSDIAGNGGVRDFAEASAIALATVGESIVGLVRLIRALGGSFQSVAADAVFLGTVASKVQVLNKGGVFNEDNRNEIRAALDRRNQVVEEANERYVKLFTDSGTKVTDALRSQFAAQRLGAQAGLNDIERLFPQAAGKPALNFNAPDLEGSAKALREAEQRRAAVLQQALRALDAAFADERDVVEFQQQFLQAQYRDGLVSVNDYYTQRAALDQRALQVELDGFAQRADLVRTEAQRFKEGSDERIKLETQLADIEAKASAARRESAQRTQLDAIDQTAVFRDLAERVREFQSELLELQGDAAGAAALRADAAIDRARRSSVSLGLSQADVTSFERAIRANTELADVQRRVERTSEAARIAEDRFLIAAQVSGASRAEVEHGITAIRREQLDQLRALLAATEELARGQGPDSPAVQAAARLRLEYERAAAQVDQLKLRLQDFADTAASQIAGSITDAIIDGDWRGAGRRIGADLVRGILEDEFTRPLQDGIRQILRGGVDGSSGAGSLLGNAVTRALGSVLGGGSEATPSPERDALRRIEASAVLEPLGDAVDEVLPRFGDLGQGLLGAAQGLGTLPQLIQSLFSGIGSDGGGLLSSLASLFGFAEGGYTGDAPSTAAAGVVHGREYVFSAPAVSRLGVPTLDLLHRTARRGAPLTGLPGFADGGFVAPRVFRGGATAQQPGPVRTQASGMRVLELHAPITIQVPGNVDRRTAEHVAVAAARGVNRALARGSA